jgi:type I restriction enzyme S subunit
MQISQAWSKTVLGEVANLIGGSQPPKSDFISEEKDGYIRLLQIRDYKTDNYKTYIPIDKARRFCSKDDVMIGRYGPPVFQILRGLEGSYNVALMKAEPVDGVDKNYLYYLLKQDALFRLIDGLSQRTAGQSGVDMDALRSYPVLLPPLTEQKRIAAILDKADSLRRKNQQAIQLADQFLRAVFLDMFGDPVTNPKGWDIVKVGSIVDCIVPGRDKPKSFTGNIPWVTTNDLCHLGLTYEPKKFLGLTDFEVKEVKAKIVPKGSVLMTCVGDLGVLSVSGKDIVINQQLHAFLPSPKINNMFLMYALSLQKNFMLNMASNTTVPYMNKTICNSVPLIVPPVNDQNRFGEIYEKAQAKLIKMEQSETKCSELCNSLSQKAFAGKL